MYICIVTIANVQICTFFHPLMWAILMKNCVNLEDFRSSSMDALSWRTCHVNLEQVRHNISSNCIDICESHVSVRHKSSA